MLDTGALLAELVAELEARPELAARIRAMLAPPEPTAVEPLYLAPTEAGARYGVSRRTIHAWIARGMPAVGQGRARRVDVRAADAWLRAREQTNDAIERRARRDAARAATREAVGS